MINKIKSSIILLGLTMGIASASTSGLNFSAQKKGSNLDFTISNNSLDVISLNKRMSLGQLGELKLVFRNGKAFENQCKINSDLPTAADFIELHPNQITGYSIPLQRLKKCFNLASDTYVMTANYKGFKGGQTELNGLLSNFSASDIVFTGELKVTGGIEVQ
ncbi:hypothetical protein [Pseudoalteromonas sp.]|uniref:hypothetical protein n=1 Tax=Pseudoalteromonas sp. TaxID=53249 RepID=UPI001BCEEE7B|nr:hypothetical protein [Pseudoalteromonas sp.]